MKILLTGAFGNIGVSALRELVKHGHEVRCFDLKTKANQRTARQFADRVEIRWGDIRRQAEVFAAVIDREVIIHLAAIIPPLSEARPEWAKEINVEGTRHLLTAAAALAQPPKLIFTSSVALFGWTQDQAPPRTVADPIQPADHYSHHKAACEQMIRASSLPWAIFCLGAALPLALGRLDPFMFEVPLQNRIEFVHIYDVGLALANAVSSEDIWGKILLIGGGSRCQLYQRDLLKQGLEALGVGMLPDEAFSSTPFYTDWLDTGESQALLNYQRYSYEDFIQEVRSRLGYKRFLIRLLRPLIRWIILRQSPYLNR